MAEIDSLELKISSDSTNAVNGLDALSATLDKLKSATKGGLGLTSVANQVSKLSTSANSINGTTINNLKGLATALQTLSGIGNIKISSSIANQITAINTALNGLNVGSGASKITELVSALRPLETLGKSSLGTTVNALKKLPDALNNLDTRRLYTQIDSLTRIFKPLADEMQKVANGFSAFPNKLQKLIATTNSTTVANNALSKSYINLYAKFRMAYMAVRGIVSTLAQFIKSSNDYIENLNLFNASLGEFAGEAQKYAEQVGEIMGIDPGEWMRNQGVFMTLATGFGVVSDRAYKMSKNLTQLGYDLSSFFNLSVEESMLKLQSGLAGELEPLRRIGFDLSQARLQQEAYTLGITKKISAMTQAEKAELRYHAILSQVTMAQGDMARTLNAPANQLRILKAQVVQAGRAIGNIFIPALNAILPYAIAVVKVLRLVAESIAKLFGFELPKVDYSGLQGMASGADNLSNALDGVGDSAKDSAEKIKKLQQYTMGFDELNVINPDSSSNGSGGSGGAGASGGGSGFDFELPEYDFLDGVVSSKVDGIVDKIKGRLGEILTVVGLIGAGFLAWKISNNLFTSIGNLSTMLGNPVLSTPVKITAGSILVAVGGSIEFVGLKSAIENGLDGLNFAEIIAGGGTLTAGAAIIGKVFGSTVIGAAIGGIVAGVPAFFVGLYDACKNGLNWLNALLIPAGSTAAGAGIGAIIGSLGGPIGAGIGALIGLAVGALTDGIIAAVQNWDAIKKFFTETVPTWFDEIDWKKVGESIGDNLQNALLIIANPFLGIIHWIYDVFDFEINWNSVGEAIGKGFGKAVKFLGDAWNFLDEWLNPISLAQKLITAISTVDWKQVGETVKKYAVKAFNIGGDILSGIVKGFTDGWSDFWSDVKSFIDGFVDGFKEALGIHSPSTVFIDIANDIVLGLIQGIEDFFGDTKDSIVTWATSVKDWFTGGDGDGNIFEKFTDFASDIVSKFGTEVETKYTTVKDKITTWASKVKSWFTDEDGGGTIFDKFSNYGSDLVGKLSESIDLGVSQEDYTTIFDRISAALSSIKGDIVDIVNSILGYIQKLANGVIDGINWMIRKLNTLSIDVPDWVTEKFGIGSFGFNIKELQHITIPPIQLKSEGGFVDNGQMFIAREAGAELVGNIGRKTAVVNNEQIVASVSRGVAEANNEQNSLLQEQNSLLRALLEKETGVYLDGKRITNSVEKYQRQRGNQIVVGGGAY